MIAAVVVLWFGLLAALLCCEYRFGTTEVKTYVSLSPIKWSRKADQTGPSMGRQTAVAPFTLIVSEDGRSLMYVIVERKPWHSAIGKVEGVTWLTFVGDCVYLMVMSFTTIGFGDVVPSHPSSRAICAVTGMLGIFVFGVFIAIVYDKIRAL